MQRVFARCDRVGLRACGDEYRSRGQLCVAGFMPDPVAIGVLHRDGERARPAVGIDLDRARGERFREANALFERLRDLFVIQRVRRTVDQAAPIRDGHAAPRLQQLEHTWKPSFRSRGRALGADRARVAEKLLRDLALVFRPRSLDCRSPLVERQGLVARQKLLDLYRVIRERFGRGIDGGEPATDDDDRQPELHIGDRVAPRGAGEL